MWTRLHISQQAIQLAGFMDCMMAWKSVLLLLFNLVLIRATTDPTMFCTSSTRLQLPSVRPVASCITESGLCLQNDVREVLAGNTTSLTCELTGIITFTRSTGSSEPETLSDGGRFSISGRTLTITNVQPEDEAEYRCTNADNSLHEICLTVTGSARFVTCDNNFTFSYVSPLTIPSNINSCSQDLNVTEGDDVVFDTRLMFGVGGDCQCIEGVTLLRVRRDPYDDDQIIYSCNEHIEMTNDCIDKGGFEVRRASDTPFDFSLMLPSVNMNDGGMYFIEVEVMQPGVGSSRRFWKIFQLTVNPAPPTTTMMTSEPTTPTTTMMTSEPTTPTPTMGATTSNPPGTHEIGGVDPVDPGPRDSLIIGSVIGCVLFVFIALLVVLVVSGVIILVKHRRANSSEIEDKKEECHYEEIADIHVTIAAQSRPVAQGHPVVRESTYFISSSFVLPTELESKHAIL